MLNLSGSPPLGKGRRSGKNQKRVAQMATTPVIHRRDVNFSWSSTICSAWSSIRGTAAAIISALVFFSVVFVMLRKKVGWRTKEVNFF